MSIEDLLKKVFAEVFSEFQVNRNFKTLKMGDFEEWDSLGNYTLLIAVEQRFGVHFTSRDLIEINSVDSIMEYINTFATKRTT